MAETYTGSKFRTVFVGREPPRDGRIAELVAWCRRFARLGLAPGGAGNLSFRSAQGFVISRTAADLAAIQPEEFVEVLQVDATRREVTAAGGYEPSSESLMHAAVYRARSGTNAVFHGHSEKLLARARRLGLPATRRERPYGTAELAAEVLKVLDGHDLIVIKNHGLLSLGKEITEAGQRVEEALARLAGSSPLSWGPGP